MMPAPNRYIQMIRQMLETLPEDKAVMQMGDGKPSKKSAAASTQTAGTLDIRMGLYLPLVMRHLQSEGSSNFKVPWRKSWTDPLQCEDWSAQRVKDQAGHWRGVYDVLVPYCILVPMMTFRTLVPMSAGMKLVEWAGWHHNQLKLFQWPDGPLPAAMGSEFAVACWRASMGAAVAFAMAGDEQEIHASAQINLAEQVAHEICQRQNSNGSLLTPSRGDNPEPMWYHELQILHALGNLGKVLVASERVEAGQRAIQAAQRNAEYHQNETQPDHATAQPWGINVAMSQMETWPLADQLIQAAMFNPAGQMDAVSLMLLADCLYWTDDICIAGIEKMMYKPEP